MDHHIANHGASDNGTTLDTTAIQKAVDSVGAVLKGSREVADCPPMDVATHGYRIRLGIRGFGRGMEKP